MLVTLLYKEAFTNRFVSRLTRLNVRWVGGWGGGGGWHVTSILQFNKIIIPAAVVTIAPCFAHELV